MNLTYDLVKGSYIDYKSARKALKDHRSVLKLGKNWPKVRK